VSYPGKDDTNPVGEAPALLRGGGEMGPGSEADRAFANLFDQAPTFIARLHGPEHRFELANPSYRRLVGDRDVLGRTMREAVPESVSQGYVALLDQVYATGVPYTAIGRPLLVQATANGEPSQRYVDFVYQPIKDRGQVTGILVIGVDATDRTLSEIALRDSESRFRDIADATPALMWIADTSKTCTWFNTPWLTFTGRTLDQERGYGWVEGVHPEDLDRCVQVYDRAFDRRESYRTEYRRRRYDGQWRILEASGVPRFTNSVFAGYIGSCLDVTDQRMSARTLSDREEQLRLATEAAEVGLWDVDGQTGALFWPPRVKAMFGISAEVPVTMDDYYNGVHPDDRAHTMAAYRAALDPIERALYEVEYRTVGKEDGVIRWVAAKGRGIFREGRCVRVIGTAIDITTRKAAEKQLRELNERLEQRVAHVLADRQVFLDIVDSTDAGIQVLDRDFRIMAINRTTANDFHALYGVRPKVGDVLLDLLRDRPEQRQIVAAFWGRALAGEEFTTIGEFGDDPAGRRYFEIKFNALRDRDGALIGAFQFVYDVTARCRDQARLEAAEKQLRQAQKLEAIGQLTGGVAHDFNNLLMVIAGGLSVLQRSPEPARRERILAQMSQAAARGASLSRQLLGFARQQPLKPEAVDLRRHVSGMRELLDRTLRSNVEVRTAFLDGLWPVYVDPAEFELVVLNLCVNSRDAMPTGGVITISARNAPEEREGQAAGDFVALSVADTGTGMTEEVLAHLFEPFFTTKPVGKGSGLGLPQVYGFAQQSQGFVRVQSAVGQGTTVTLFLPRSAGVPEHGDIPRPHWETPGKRRDVWRGSILLVEDDDEVAALVTEMLGELGYRTTRAASAQAALGALADDREFDLAFSDVMMPGAMNGVDLAKEIKVRRPGLPVLLTTGYAEPFRGAAQSEHIHMLRKPYELQELDKALSAAMRQEALGHSRQPLT
jgi:PAS domain S-box-containing protein